jgi:hypothetical protein
LIIVHRSFQASSEDPQDQRYCPLATARLGSATGSPA